MNKTPFTKEGYEKLIIEKSTLEKERVSAVANLKQARDMGDLSENAAYKVARSKLSSIDSRLRRVNSIMDNAYIMSSPRKGIVDVGSVVILDSDFGEKTFQIVNSIESDVVNGKISYYSPVGKALIGRKVNDIVIINTPKGETKYKIVKIKEV